MGHRLHSATKYEVKYGMNAYFNWASEHINFIVECLAEDTFWSDDSGEALEADKETLLRNLPNILTPNPEWENQEELDCLLEDMENDKECGIKREYLYEGLKDLIDASDPNNHFVHFVWF